ncbi:MAG: lysylphosphatidylglycerol synthase transmembrane domain-containing protein [Hylemonella sp.]|nr:lysylphosphatidylglycerol synthase transmembrane domain-containing protein [Hylemonella sp.]
MKLPLKSLLLVIGGAATVYALVLLLSGERASVHLLQELLSPAGALAAALCLLNYVLRGQRWRLWMAHYERPLPLLQGLRLYLAGYTFTPTPGNVGEAARGLLLRQPLGTADSLAIFGAERVADLLALLLLTLPGLWWLSQRPGAAAWQLQLIAAALAISLLSAAVLYRYRRTLWQRLPWLQGAWHCLARRPWTWLGLTLVAWAAQGLATWLLCRAFGLGLDPLLATGFYALAMVGGALSMLPAGLGGTEALLTGLLVLQGAALATAVAVTVLVRLLTLWLAVAIGALALLYSAAVSKDISLR